MKDEERKETPKEEEKQEKVKQDKVTLYIQNLSKDTSQEDVMALLKEKCSEVEILDLRVITKESDGKTLGFIDVKSLDEAGKLLQLSGTSLKDQKLSLFISKKPKHFSMELAKLSKRKTREEGHD